MHKIIFFLNLLIFQMKCYLVKNSRKILLAFGHLCSDRPDMWCYVLLRLQEMDVGLSTGLIWLRIRKYVGLL